MTTLQGTYINKQPYVLVPLKTLVALLGRNAPVKLMMPTAAIQPPLSEAEEMDATLENYRQHGLPEYVVSWTADEGGWGE